MEGRIWKLIAQNLTDDQILNVWKYFDSYSRKDSALNYKNTIDIFRNTIKITRKFSLNKSIRDIAEMEEEKNDEKRLKPVHDIKSLLTILFRYGKKQAAFSVIEDGYTKDKIDISVFELCLYEDEEIALELIRKYNLINNDNAKSEYFEFAVTKRFFKLAYYLMSYDVCRNFLNNHPPKKDLSHLIMKTINKNDKKVAKIKYVNELKEGKSKVLVIPQSALVGDTHSNQITELSENVIHSYDNEHDKKTENYINNENINNNENHSQNNPYSKYDHSSKNSSFISQVHSEVEVIDSTQGNLIPNEDLLINDKDSLLKSDKSKTVRIIENKDNTKNKITDGEGDKSLSSRNVSKSKHLSKKSNNANISEDILTLKDNIKAIKNNNNNTVLSNNSYNLINSNKDIKENNLIKEEERKNESINSDSGIVEHKSNKSNNLNNNSNNKENSNNIENIENTNITDNLEETTPKDDDKSIDKSNNDNNNDDNEDNTTTNTKNKIKKETKKEKIFNFTSGCIDIQNIIVQNLKYGDTVFYSLNILCAINDNFIDITQIEKICKSLSVYIKDSNDEFEILLCKYPILVCVLGAELLIKIGNLSPKNKYRCDSIAKALLDLGMSIQLSLKEDIFNYYLINNFDWKGRSTLEIIAENRFYDLLRSPFTLSIVNNYWYGKQGSNTLTRFSGMYTILFTNIIYKSYDEIVDDILYTKYSLTYSFQFDQYIYNCSLRHIINSIAQIVISILFQIIVFLFVEFSKEGTIAKEDSNFLFISYLSNGLILCQSINYVFYMIFLVKTERKLSFDISLIVELIFLISVLIDITDFSSIILPTIPIITGLFYNTTYYEFGNNTNVSIDNPIYTINELNNEYLKNTTNTTSIIDLFNSSYFNANNTLSPITVPINYKTTKDSQLFDAIVYSTIIICAWIKVVSVMTTTRTFGPFLRILYLLVGIMLNFALIYFFFNMVWAQSMTLIFGNDNYDYAFFFDSFISLFNATFGQYDLTRFRTSQLFGYIFSIIYVIMANIMLLGLFTAIVSNQYKTHQENSDFENRVSLISTYKNIKWDNKWGLLILLPTPLNMIGVLFMGILLVVPNDQKEKYNIMFSKICYVFIALFQFLLLVIINIVLFPFAIIKSYLHSLYDTCKDKITAAIFFKGILMFFVRPFVLLFYVGKDLVYYWKVSCTTNEIVKLDDEMKDSELDRKVIIKIRSVLLLQKMKYNKKKLTLSKLFKLLNIHAKKSKDNISNKTVDFEQEDSHLSFSDTSLKNENSPNTSVINPDGSNKNGNSDISSDDATKDISKDGSYDNDFTNNNNSNTIRDEEKLKKDENKLTKKYIYKFVDSEKFLNINRTLTILENKLVITNNYHKFLELLDIKYLIRGISNFHYRSSKINHAYEYRKIGHVLNKIHLKLKFVGSLLPKRMDTHLQKKWFIIDENFGNQRTYANLKQKVENDVMTEIEEEENAKDYKLEPKSTYKNVGINNANQRKNIDKITKVLRK